MAITITYNGVDVTGFIALPEFQAELNRAIDAVTTDWNTSDGVPPLPDVFSLTITGILRWRIRPYQHHCNKHLRNRIFLAPYRRVRWGAN